MEKTFYLDSYKIREIKLRCSDWARFSVVGYSERTKKERGGGGGGGLAYTCTKLEVSAEAEDAASLNTLDLDLSAIKTVIGTEKLINVKQLLYSCCKLKNIPEWIKNLKNVEKIHLSTNDIKEIPPWISELQQLQYLRLSWNKNLGLGSLPHFGEKLSSLDISDCDIKALPEDFFQHQLKKVNLNGNRNLLSIPSVNESLEELNIAICDIQTLPENLFY